MLTIVPATVLVAHVAGADTAPEPCEDDSCVMDRATAAYTAGDPDSAVAILKKGRTDFPESRAVGKALGAAYFHAGNEFWAIRIFSSLVEADNNDCGARAWLAWIFLQQAALDAAGDALDNEACASGKRPEAARFLAVRALLADSRGDKKAAMEDVRAARKKDTAWPGDREALRTLPNLIYPHSVPEVSARLESRYGYTSNALMGSAVDTAGEDKASSMFRQDVWLRFTTDFGVIVQPLAEFQTRIVRYLEEDAKDFSYMNLTGRIGLLIGGRTLPRVTLSYRPDYLLLDRGDQYGDGPVWYFGAHRGDIEIEALPWLMVMAGAGQRVFREASRTRIEVDAGLGGGVPIKGPVSLLWGLTGRVFRAREAAYHVYGGTALVRAGFRLPHMFLVRLGVTLAVDYYPDSRGYFATEQRRDIFVKTGLEVWSPPLFGTFRGMALRAGATYEFTDRESTASGYEYMDHRFNIRIAWTWGSDVNLPSAAETVPSARIPWGAGGRDGEFGDRIQDLLRQDDEIMRSSSCVQ